MVYFAATPFKDWMVEGTQATVPKRRWRGSCASPIRIYIPHEDLYDYGQWLQDSRFKYVARMVGGAGTARTFFRDIVVIGKVSRRPTGW